jgi:hypothetical protein
MIDFVHFDNILVRESLRAIKLASQVRKDLWTSTNTVVEDLYCDMAIAFWKIGTVPIQRLEYGPHSATAENSLQNVTIP